MTKLFSFIGPALRTMGGGLGFLADSHEKNPKTGAALSTILVAGAGMWGVSPETMATIGGIVVKLGEMMGAQ